MRGQTIKPPHRLKTQCTLLLKCLAVFSVLGGVGAADPFTTPAPGVLQPPSPPSPSPSPPPLNQSPNPIVNDCGVEGPVPDEYMVNLKPKHPSYSEGRRLDTREDKLSYLESFVHRYDHEVDSTSNGTNRRKLDPDSKTAVVAMYYLTETRLAVGIEASEEVRHVCEACSTMLCCLHVHSACTPAQHRVHASQVILLMAKDPAVFSIERGCLVRADFSPGAHGSPDLNESGPLNRRLSVQHEDVPWGIDRIDSKGAPAFASCYSQRERFYDLSYYRIRCLA